ncbi:MAG: RidA family protein [Thermoplasmata archaeon]|nr:RidA family protein [Thermoplasmata archaeon]
MTPTPSARLAGLGLVLPPPPTPKGTYAPVVVSGGLAYVSGQIVTDEGRIVHPGLVDAEVPTDVAKDLARRATLQGLSALQRILGSIDRIRQVLRVGVYVASSPGFVRQHEVANGATDLLVDVFGEAGRPARASVGVVSLPLGAAVEVELLVAVE